MKHHVGLTMDAQLFREIERIRGREKRSTFIEHLIRLGLKVYIKNENSEPTKNISFNQNCCIENYLQNKGK